MLVSIGLTDSLEVTVQDDGAYSPDVMDDLCSRARDAFRLALADLRHDQAEHE